MGFKDYRKESQKRWGCEGKPKDGLTTEQINCGSLLRIADASETMAQNHLQMQNDIQYWKDRAENAENREQALKRSNTSLKGTITRLKAKIEELQAQ